MSPFRHQSLKFQIISVLVIILVIPILVMLYDILYASKSDRIVLESKQERLGTIVDSLALHLGKKANGNSEERLALLVDEFNRTAAPLAETHPGVRVGLYIPDNEKIYIQGFLHQFRDLTPAEQQLREERIYNEVYQGIQAAIASEAPISRIGHTWDDQFLEYLVPVKYGDELVAVVWAEQTLHPIFAKGQHFRLLTRYATLGVFCISALGLLLVVTNLTNHIRQIKHGLVQLENDIYYRLPEAPGEIGQITRAINKMGQGLAEKEQLEEQLRRSDCMAALGRLVTGISHELRNPLGIINATVQVMEEELKHVPDANDYLQRIKQQIERQNRVVNELLDFGRPSKEAVEEVDLNGLLRRVLAFSEPLLRQRQITVETLFEDRLPPVMGHSEKLKQVFLNLVLNAVQAMPDDAGLRVRTRVTPDWVIAEVEDDGPGIQETDLPHIFEPFYTTKDGGSGLGLAISFQIIGMHGGRLKAGNVPSGGAIMTVHLPRRKGGEPKDGDGIRGSESADH
ncbi:MAG: two-component sensor histidine kinase [Candidatus Desulforudis sp.]|nr:two-component sensor histidine kinase [Desulforudis sp.]